MKIFKFELLDKIKVGTLGGTIGLIEARIQYLPPKESLYAILIYGGDPISPDHDCHYWAPESQLELVLKEEVPNEIVKTKSKDDH